MFIYKRNEWTVRQPIMFQGSWAKIKRGGGGVGLSGEGLGRSSVFFALSTDPWLDPPYSRLKRRKEGKEERERGGVQRRAERRVSADGDGWRSRRALSLAARGADAV